MLHNLALEVDGVTQSCPGGMYCRWCYTILPWRLEGDGVSLSGCMYTVQYVIIELHARDSRAS